MDGFVTFGPPVFLHMKLFINEDALPIRHDKSLDSALPHDIQQLLGRAKICFPAITRLWMARFIIPSLSVW